MHSLPAALHSLPPNESASMHITADGQGRLLPLNSAAVGQAQPGALTDLVQLTATLCETPMAIVSLVADEDQGFQAQVGLEQLPLASRESTFCKFAIQQAQGVLEIEDAQADPRFCNNPLVQQQPNLRFYAGVPLVNAKGRVLGSLCAMHHLPHRLRPEQRAALELLAREATVRLESLRYVQQLRQQLTLLQERMQLVQERAAPQTAARNEIFVKNGSRLERVNMADICYVEALGDYVNIYTTNADRLTAYTSMKELESKLPAFDFVRVQRKYIIRLDCLQAIEGDSVLVQGPKEALYIPIGNSYKTALLNRLNLI